MLNGDDLFALERYLDDQRERDASVIEGVRDVLGAIYALPSYQAWLNEPSQFVTQYELPPEFGFELSESTRRLLDRFRIINGSDVQVKIDKHGERIHLTDGPWVPPNLRVYPFADESQLLCDYIVHQGLQARSDLLIDPACGCGHHGLALSMIPSRVYLDINLRALAFCRINSILCGEEHMLAAVNDIRHGFPLVFDQIHCDSALVVVNMPFGIFPRRDELPATLAQDGGDRGVALTFAVLEAVKKLAQTAKGLRRLRLVLLFYSLGTKKRGGWEWEVESKARECFPESRILVTLLQDEKMWRVNGVKSESNPMDLSRLVQKADCSQTFAPNERKSARLGYTALEKLYRHAGFDHLGYGILDVEVR